MKASIPMMVPMAALLAGCAASTPAAPVTAPTVTATVTATPAPTARSAADPLTALDAWLACSGAVQGSYALNHGGTQMSAFEPAMVSAGTAGSFLVKVNFQPPGGSTTNAVAGAQGACTVSGTIGSPVIRDIAFTDFG